jgi:phosphohistidine phosphatase
MDMLIVRHAIAEDREQFALAGQPDDLRPLAAEGIREFSKVARALRRVVPTLELIATSPLVRARQTADLLNERYDARLLESDALRPETPYAKLAALIKQSNGVDVVAIVGHEPHLSGLVAWLIGDASARITLKKGGACVVRFDRTAAWGRDATVVVGARSAASTARLRAFLWIDACRVRPRSPEPLRVRRNGFVRAPRREREGRIVGLTSRPIADRLVDHQVTAAPLDRALELLDRVQQANERFGIFLRAHFDTARVQSADDLVTDALDV